MSPFTCGWCLFTVGLLHVLVQDIGSTEDSAAKTYVLKGCYELERGVSENNKSDKNSPNWCFHICSNSSYSGLKYKKCYCLDSVKEEALSNNSSCTERCPGNDQEICGQKGNPGFMSVYQRKAQKRRGRMVTGSASMTVSNNQTTHVLNASEDKNETFANTTVQENSNFTCNNTYEVCENETLVNSTEMTATNNQTTVFDTNTSFLEKSTSIVLKTTSYNVNNTPSNDTTMEITNPDPVTMSTENKTDSFIKIKDDTTNLSDLIQDIDSGLVAGMSVMVVAIFASCFVFAFARKCYRKGRRKPEPTIYEEVEDAATSCSIEGSSNIKLLIGRARNINKSRIEQINEEWKTGEALLMPNNAENSSIVSAPSSPSPLPETELKFFAKSSVKSNKKVIIDDEDSEYATAEPDDDLYSVARDDARDVKVAETSLTTTSATGFDGSGTSSVDTIASNNMSNKLQGSTSLDEEDPYEITEEGEYDTTNSVRPHKQYDKEEEDPYILTEEGEYDTLGEFRPHVGQLHRSKSLERLSENLNPPENLSESSSNEIFDDTLEGEYDILNKPRFRFSSCNYDSVKLPWENETNENDNTLDQGHIDEKRFENSKDVQSAKANETNDNGNRLDQGNIDEKRFENLEHIQSAEANMYSDMESLLNTNKNDSTGKLEDYSINQLEFVCNDVNEINGNNHLKDEVNCDSTSPSTIGKSSGEHSPSVSVVYPTEPSLTGLIYCSNVNPIDNESDAAIIIQNKCFGKNLENGNIVENKMNVC